jgi:DNA polymerase IV
MKNSNSFLMRVIMHADMNSYFASVEQQANPFLRGKPIAICSRISPDACIIACSMEAKKLGVKTGFGLREARELAPGILALEVDPAKVRSTTDRIFAIFADYTSSVEAYSIDEAFLDLTGMVGSFEEAEVKALEIKKRIKDEVGEWLRCSIGISSTRWLAKFAGELKKPDGLTVLSKEELPSVYGDKAVDEAWGIAKGWKIRLEAIGIRTLGELLKADPLELKRRFGMPGYMIWANIAGLDIEQVKPIDNGRPKSVGHSYVFHKRTAQAQMISAIMMKLCERVGRRLRRIGLEAKNMSVSWGYDDSGDALSVRCPEPLFDSYELFSHAWKAFRAKWDGRTVTFLAVTSYDLSAVSGQLSFFTDKRKRRAIAQALDKVNDRHGEYAIIRGRMWGTEQWAPERVGFRKTLEPVWRGEGIALSLE